MGWLHQNRCSASIEADGRHGDFDVSSPLPAAGQTAAWMVSGQPAPAPAKLPLHLGREP